jgi:hypothetical protein
MTRLTHHPGASRGSLISVAEEIPTFVGMTRQRMVGMTRQRIVGVTRQRIVGVTRQRSVGMTR